MGNSSSRLVKQLKEQHSEEYLKRMARYLTDCSQFVDKPLHVTLRNPPDPHPLPSYKWILTVYSQDILTRLSAVKARITSTYGNILKMDSTKKVIIVFGGGGGYYCLVIVMLLYLQLHPQPLHDQIDSMFYM